MSVNLADGKKANLREIGNLDCIGYTRNAPKTIVFGAFCYAKSYNFQRVKKSDPHRDPHRAKNAAHRQGSSASQPVRCAACFWLFLPHLHHEVAHGLCCLVLLLAGSVGVGAQGEPGVVVSQHGGDCLDIHAVLEGQFAKVCGRLWRTSSFHSAAFGSLIPGGTADKGLLYGPALRIPLYSVTHNTPTCGK